MCEAVAEGIVVSNSEVWILQLDSDIFSNQIGTHCSQSIFANEK